MSSTWSAQACGLALALAGAACTGPLEIARPTSAPVRPAEQSSEPSGEARPDLIFGGQDGTEPKVLTGPLNLNQAVRLASVRALDTRIAEQVLDAAIARADAARRAWWPSLSVGASYDHLDGVTQNTVGEFPIVNRESIGLGGEARLVIDPSDAIYEARRAEYQEDALRHGLQGVRAASIVRAARFYMDLSLAQARVRISEEAVSNAQGLEAWVQDRVDAGVALEADLERVRANRADAERIALEQRVALDLSAALLGEVLDMEVDAELIQPGPIEQLELLPAEVNLSSDAWLMKSREHPDWAQSQSRIQAAEARQTGIERDWLLPRFEIRAAIDKFGEDLDSTGRRERYGAALTWDLDFGMPARSRRARAETQQARLEQLRLQRQLESQLRSALLRVHAGRQRIPLAQTQVRAASAAYRLADERQRGGAGLTIEVVDAMLSLRRAEAAEAAAIAEYGQAQLDLLLATGQDPLPLLLDATR